MFLKRTSTMEKKLISRIFLFTSFKIFAKGLHLSLVSLIESALSVLLCFKLPNIAGEKFYCGRIVEKFNCNIETLSNKSCVLRSIIFIFDNYLLYRRFLNKWWMYICFKLSQAGHIQFPNFLQVNVCFLWSYENFSKPEVSRCFQRI